MAMVADQVRHEIDTYITPESPDQEKFGQRLSDEWVHDQLIEMRNALVPPYEVSALSDCGEGSGLVARSVIVIADDLHGSFIVYDPCDEGDFALALGGEARIVLAGPRGDAVGCFLAR